MPKTGSDNSPNLISVLFAGKLKSINTGRRLGYKRNALTLNEVANVTIKVSIFR